MTGDVDAAKKDAEKLEQTYTKTIQDLDKTWRALYLESNPKKHDRLEKKAETLTQAARIAAGRHELAVKVLEKLVG